MSNYVLGLGGNCCPDCTPNDACKATPIISVCGSGTGTETLFGSWAAYSSGANLTGVTWSMSPFTGLSINSSGFITGTLPSGSAGTYSITVTATNACGSASCNFSLTVNPCPSCSLSHSGSGGTGSDFTVCVDDFYSVSPNFTCAKTLNIAFDFTFAEASLVITGNLGTVYSSGCIGPTSVSTSVTVPAGTTTLHVVVTCGCAGGAPTGVTYTISC